MTSQTGFSEKEEKRADLRKEPSRSQLKKAKKKGEENVSKKKTEPFLQQREKIVFLPEVPLPLSVPPGKMGSFLLATILFCEVD